MKHTVKLNRNFQFRRLYKSGHHILTPYFALYIRTTRLKQNRIGITATKKIGNAVQRNRARRLLQEAYRLLEDQFPKGFDLVLVARKKTVYAKMQEVRDALEEALRDGRRTGSRPRKKNTQST